MSMVPRLSFEVCFLFAKHAQVDNSNVPEIGASKLQFFFFLLQFVIFVEQLFSFNFDGVEQFLLKKVIEIKYYFYINQAEPFQYLLYVFTITTKNIPLSVKLSHRTAPTPTSLKGNQKKKKRTTKKNSFDRFIAN